MQLSLKIYICVLLLLSKHQPYETVEVVHPELKDYLDPSRNESTDHILAEGQY